MIHIAKKVAPKVLIVVSSEEQKERVNGWTGDTRVVIDPEDAPRCALTGALTAFEYTETTHTQLLPVDTPLAKVEMLRMISGLAEGHGAVVPIWPNEYREPLHSVYLAEHAYAEGLQAMRNGKMRMQNMIERLHNVLGISTLVLQQFDEELLTFRNINTREDLKTLERIT